MKNHIEAIFKKVATTGNLSSDNIDALIHELTMASELIEHITEHVPQHYAEYLILPRHQKAFREIQDFFKKTAPCDHSFVSLGPVAVDRDTKTGFLSFSILKQCKWCKTITLEPADF